ncbi:hypothetical protein ES708_30126 [subsurface metagenome]
MLTLDKALEIVGLYEHAASSIPRDDFLDALNLTIEATKRFKALREVIRVPLTDPLPGEDEE